ncbi:hypothetical protein TSOC_004306 [Tetrabaena socialis]|uniref:Macro domain-containing protein n=1 Tax=Tetrabaena socialis TaxID=47790 RepID=A0A2J8A9A6_9CHLO|nr:hypothetical protein TSOC_004306 [Tetrabaena socialis]|eukprot:PNH09090.1 hypothetical protein TSOC_004306 [Tetrabaena socialis]
MAAAASGGPPLIMEEYQLLTKKEYQLEKGLRLIICEGRILDWPKLQHERPDPPTKLAVVISEVHLKAGPKFAKELLARPLLRPGIRCLTGEAVETKGYDFKVDWIIHTCGPSYDWEHSRCKDDLANAYRSSLTKAQQLGVKCVAFPAFSVGLQGYSAKDVTQIALSMLKDAKAPLDEVWIVLDGQADFDTATGVAAGLGLSEYVVPSQSPNMGTVAAATGLVLMPQRTPSLLEQNLLQQQQQQQQQPHQQQEEPQYESGNLDNKAELDHLEGSAGFIAEQQQDPSFKLLHFLAMLGHVTLEEALEQAGRQQQQQAVDMVKAKDTYGCTPLQLAAACGNLSMVKALLEPFGLHDRELVRPGLYDRDLIKPGTVAHTLINDRDAQVSFTALHGAISQGQFEVALLLLQLGADPQAKDKTLKKRTAFELLVTVHLMTDVLESQCLREMIAAAARAAAREHTGEQLPGAPIMPNRQYATVVKCFERVERLYHLPLLCKAMVEPLVSMLGEHQQHAMIVKCFNHAVHSSSGDVVATAMLDLIMNGHSGVLRLREWCAVNRSLVSFMPRLFQHLITKLQSVPDDDMRFVRALRPQSVSAGIERIVRAELESSLERENLQMFLHLSLGLDKADYRVVKAFFEEASEELLNGMAAYPIYVEFVGCLAADRQPSLAVHEARQGGALEGAGAAPVESLSASQRLPGATLIPPSQLARDLREIIAEQQPGPKAPMSMTSRTWGKVFGATSSSRVLPTTTATADANSGTASAMKRLGPETLYVERVLRAAMRGCRAHNVQAAVESITRWVDTNGQATAVFVTGISTDLLKELALRFPAACAKILNLVSRGMSSRLATIHVPASLLHCQSYRVKCSSIHSHFTWQDRELRMLPLAQGYSEAVASALVDYGLTFECVVKAAVGQGTSAEDFAALIDEGFTGPELQLLISNNVPLAAICKHIAECRKPLPDSVPMDIKDKLLSTPMSEVMRDMLRTGRNPDRIINTIISEGTMSNFLRTEFMEVHLLQLCYPRCTHHFVQLLLINWCRGIKDKAGEWSLRPWGSTFIDTIFAPDNPLCAKLKSAYNDTLMEAQVYLENHWAAVDEQPLLDREAMAFLHPWWHRLPVAVLAWLLLWLRRKLLRLWSQVKESRLWPGVREEAESEHVRALVDARALVIPWRCISDMGSVVPQQPAATSDPATTNASDYCDTETLHAQSTGGDSTMPPLPPPRATKRTEHFNRGILTTLVRADVPVRWYGFTVVKAVVAVHWREQGLEEFGQTLMLLSALVHIMFMVTFSSFLLVLRLAEEQEDGDMGMIRKRLDVNVLLAVLGLLSIGGLSEEVAQMREITVRTWRNHLGNLTDFTSFVLVFAVIGMVWSKSKYDEILAVCAVEALVLFVRLIFFASMTDSMGSLMRMVIEIIKDMRYFFLLLGLTFGGFAIAFAVLQGPTYSYESIALKLFSVMMGEWTLEYVEGMLHEDGNWWVY